MKFALASFDIETGQMDCALYCTDCGKGSIPAGNEWRAVILQDGEDFCCDACFTTEAPETPINGSAYVLADIERRANGKPYIDLSMHRQTFLQVIRAFKYGGDIALGQKLREYLDSKPGNDMNDGISYLATYDEANAIGRIVNQLNGVSA